MDIVDSIRRLFFRINFYLENAHNFRCHYSQSRCLTWLAMHIFEQCSNDLTSYECLFAFQPNAREYARSKGRQREKTEQNVGQHQEVGPR